MIGKLNYIHRVVGRIMCLAINVHALGFSESGASDRGFPTLLICPMQSTSGLYQARLRQNYDCVSLSLG